MTTKRLGYFLHNFLFWYETKTLASRFSAVFKPKIAFGNDCKCSEDRQVSYLCHQCNPLPAVPDREWIVTELMKTLKCAFKIGRIG